MAVDAITKSLDFSSLNKPGFVEKVIVATLFLIVAFGIMAVVVQVAFDKSVLDVVITVYGALGLNGVGTALKGIKDTPLRQQEALNQTAQVAATQNIAIPIAPSLANSANGGLQVWTPQKPNNAGQV